MKRAPWPVSVSRPVATPLQPSVVYAADDPDSLDDQYEGRTHGYTYAREGHPNAGVLAGLIDGMEGASGGVVVSSGMAAISLALLGVLKAGDHVIGQGPRDQRTPRLRSLGTASSPVGAPGGLPPPRPWSPAAIRPPVWPIHPAEAPLHRSVLGPCPLHP